MANASNAEWLNEQRASAQKLMRKSKVQAPRAVAVAYNRRTKTIAVEMNNGASFSFPQHLAQGLESGKPTQWADVQLSPMGTGLHWPQLDADLSVQGLLEGLFGSDAWRKAHAARAGGVKSEAKAMAARLNGAKGGRPKAAR
jgi:hypothetical protein